MCAVAVAVLLAGCWLLFRENGRPTRDSNQKDVAVVKIVKKGAERVKGAFERARKGERRKLRAERCLYMYSAVETSDDTDE